VMAPPRSLTVSRSRAGCDAGRDPSESCLKAMLPRPVAHACASPQSEQTAGRIESVRPLGLH
jgi:hypothetical protein